MTPTNAQPANTNANPNTKPLALTGDWILFGAVTSLLMWHNGYTTYKRVSHSLGHVSANGINLIALAEALVTVIVVEFTSAYFLHAQKTEVDPTRRKIAAWGVVIPLLISGIINLNISDEIADGASRIATMCCACIVAAWHWFTVHENPIEALKAEIKALAAKLQAVTRERDDALAQAAAAGAGSDRAAAIIRGLQNDIETLRREHNAALTAVDARHRDEIERLTHQHNTALAAAKANATANVTVNVAQSPNAQLVSAPLALTEDALALTIAERRANGEPVSSALLANLFNVSQSRIRQMTAWANREVTA